MKLLLALTPVLSWQELCSVTMLALAVGGLATVLGLLMSRSLVVSSQTLQAFLATFMARPAAAFALMPRRRVRFTWCICLSAIAVLLLDLRQWLDVFF